MPGAGVRFVIETRQGHWHICGLLLACAGLAASATAGQGTAYPALAKRSCGDVEGGALHISLLTEHGALLLHANDLVGGGRPWVGKTNGAPRLVVLACDVSAAKCIESGAAALRLDFQRGEQIAGKLSYFDAAHQQRTLRFEAQVQPHAGACG